MNGETYDGLVWDEIMAKKFPLITGLGVKIFARGQIDGTVPFIVYAYELEKALSGGSATDAGSPESTPEDEK